jgi:hypothetical protein
VFYTLSLFPSLRVPFFLRLISYNSLEAAKEGDLYTLEDTVLNQQKVVTVRLMIRNIGGKGPFPALYSFLRYN